MHKSGPRRTIDLVELAGALLEFARFAKQKVREVHALAPVEGTESEEIILDGREMGQARTYLVRIIKDDKNRKVYFIYAWAQSRRFPEVQPDLRKAMDSFRILKDR